MMLRIRQRLLLNQQLTKGFHTSAQCAAITRFNLPAMSPTMTEGTIHQWKFKEGESFSAGDVLLELETDKAQIDVEAPEDGVLAKIVLPDGGKAAVNSLIALIAEEGDDISNVQVPEEGPASSSVSQEKTTQQVEEPEKKKAAPTVSPISHDDVDTSKLKKPLSPAVLSLVLKHGIKDVGSIEPSGYGGRLLKGDVLAHLGLIQPKPAPKPKLSIAPPRDQIVFAKNAQQQQQQQQQEEVAQKKQIPPSFITKQLSLDKVFDLHQSLNEQKKIQKTTVNDVIAKAAERALQEIQPSAKGGIRFKQPVVYRESSHATEKKYKGGEFKVFNLAEAQYDFITDSYENGKPYVLQVEPVGSAASSSTSRKEHDDMVDFIHYLGDSQREASRHHTSSAATQLFDIKLDGKVPGKILNDAKAKVFLDRVEYYVHHPGELY
ncbi:hypothetical protein BDF20DRAFT_869707 [Mycotypha africana]|uniref:uncharacterized protein n=1 Tax=Mycotypha africana TaxID=64632 RepID=UPI0023018F42|nr:uncharacterized protein BDF20DRAFT_869707 [Mycotypha africana]KAI8979465.1 hypothetical protein BDF20DRAFT_869707 [Mycotypha africana]